MARPCDAVKTKCAHLWFLKGAVRKKVNYDIKKGPYKYEAL